MWADEGHPGYWLPAACTPYVSERSCRTARSTFCAASRAPGVKESYKLMAERFGVPWGGRRYDRANPQAADLAKSSPQPCGFGCRGCRRHCCQREPPQCRNWVSSTRIQASHLYSTSPTSGERRLRFLAPFAPAREASERPNMPVERIARRLTGEDAGQGKGHSCHDRADKAATLGGSVRRFAADKVLARCR